MSRVDNRLATLGLNAFPDIGVNKRPAGHIFDAVRPALQYPENRVASRMDKTLDSAAIPLQVDQHGCVHLVPIPGIVLMVLEVRFHFAAIGVEREH